MEKTLRGAAARLHRWRGWVIALALVPALAVRLWLIRHFPEPDLDAKGHLSIARAVLHDPWNVAIHWVWLPAYHFVLAGLLALGLTGEGVRVVNAVLAVLVPLTVLGYVEDTARDARARFAGLMAALLCAASPLVNLLGTSAQQETLFTLLVVGAVWAIDRARFLLAGTFLALTVLIRYEAWGAVALLVAAQVVVAVGPIARWLPARLAEALRFPLALTGPSLVAMAGWLVAHKIQEGTWLGFLRELYRYTHVQRDGFGRTTLADLLWFPVQQPLFVFGSAACLLFFVGLRRAWRPSWLVPLGIYGFLLGAYVFKGTLGSARYYESMTPFVAIAAAYGITLLGQWRRWLVPAAFAYASWQLVSLSTQLCRWTWAPGSEAMVAAAEERAAAAHTTSPPPVPAPPAHPPTRSPTAARR